MKLDTEPKNILPTSVAYASDLSRAFNWYNQNKDKKDARSYLKSYVGREKSKLLDNIPDNKISSTYSWMARMVQNGCQFKTNDIEKLDAYVKEVLKFKQPVTNTVKIIPVVEKPTVREHLEEKTKLYLGELEGVLDDMLFSDATFDLYRDMKARNIPSAACVWVEEWVKKKAGEYIGVYESNDKFVKESYENVNRRKLTSVIKTLSQWLEEIERYSQFKKVNRKPREKKVKPAGVQVSKLRYKKEDAETKLKSINPVNIVGATQVWVYNVRYRKLSVYRTDSKIGIQVKGSTLNNYDPSLSEQKIIRKPSELLKKVLEGGKLVLRKLLEEVKSNSMPVTGRINSDCIILRAI